MSKRNQDRDSELELAKLKLAKLERLQQLAELERSFPHRYLHKFYKWQRAFFNDWEHKKQVVCAPNQVGKSSNLIKKLIECAISPDKWRTYWPTLPKDQKPAQWWYLYPTKEILIVDNANSRMRF